MMKRRAAFSGEKGHNWVAMVRVRRDAARRSLGNNSEHEEHSI
jgi:hypothetical protein